MKVFDSRWEGPHGIGRFATEIHRRLTGFQDVALKGRPSAALDPLRLSRHLRALAPQLYFSPGYNVPLGHPCPFVFCLHDLNHISVPENATALKRAYYRYVIRPAVHRAEVVLTVSEFSRRAICDWAGTEESKVVNVGNGVSEAFRPDGPAYDRIGRPYILYVGNQRPHKNLPRLLRAFAACAMLHEFVLVLVGTGQPAAALGRLVAELRLRERTLFLEKTSEERLAELYRGAVALALVSTYEGFGLPIIEAMACGTPVLTSPVAAMPEVAADAAVLVDPGDVQGIADTLQRLVSDSALRKTLRERGLAQAKLFSWDNTARAVARTLAERLPYLDPAGIRTSLETSA